MSDSDAPQPESKRYATGAVRSADRNNVRYDLITPIGLKRLAETYAEGANKRGAHNWENGMPVDDLLNHALAHIYDYLAGDRSQDHLAHAAWNVLGAIHSEVKWPHLNDDKLRTGNCDVPRAAAVPTSSDAAMQDYDRNFRFRDYASEIASLQAEQRAMATAVRSGAIPPPGRG